MIERIRRCDRCGDRIKEGQMWAKFDVDECTDIYGSGVSADRSTDLCYVCYEYFKDFMGGGKVTTPNE